jgi:hypothetical protein
MGDSDFDLLCEGVSPEEAKRLRKVLADWCGGDEKGFPAQLALLTRAQWRAAATVPRSVHDARQSLHQEFAEHQKQVVVLLNQFEQVTSASLRDQKRLVDKLAADSAKAIAELRVPLSEAEAVARRVRLELETGAQKWTDAVAEFQIATKRLTQLCADLQARPWRSHWVLLVLLLIATFVAAYFIALHRTL